MKINYIQNYNINKKAISFGNGKVEVYADFDKTYFPLSHEEMKVATSYALASLIPDDEITEENIIAPALDKRVAEVVAKAVIKTAKETGVARI